MKNDAKVSVPPSSSYPRRLEMDIYNALVEASFRTIQNKEGVKDEALVQEFMKSTFPYKGKDRRFIREERSAVRAAVKKARQNVEVQKLRLSAALSAIEAGQDLTANPWVKVDEDQVRLSDSIIKKALASHKNAKHEKAQREWESILAAAESGQDLFENQVVVTLDGKEIKVEPKVAGAAMFQAKKILPSDTMWLLALAAAEAGQDLFSKPYIEVEGKEYKVREKMAKAAMAKTKKAEVPGGENSFAEKPKFGVGSGLSRFSAVSKTAKKKEEDRKAARREADRALMSALKSRGNKGQSRIEGTGTSKKSRQKAKKRA